MVGLGQFGAIFDDAGGFAVEDGSVFLHCNLIDYFFFGNAHLFLLWSDYTNPV